MYKRFACVGALRAADAVRVVLAATATRANSMLLAAGLSLAGATVAVATTVTIIQPTALPANAPTVAFEGLPSSGSVSSYSEFGLSLSASAISSTTFFTSPVNKAGAIQVGDQPQSLFSFNSPVSQISYLELSCLTSNITLFSDAAGTQSLGAFSTTHTIAPAGKGTFAFQSDTPFRSFRATVSNTQSFFPTTFYFDDLRYNAVPEPAAVIAGIGAVGLLLGQRRRRQA